jgi:hypothetical protein
MDLEFLASVKRMTILALYSDDELMERLVLKGGSLLDVVFGISARSSLDLDFSMEGEFADLDELHGRIDRALQRTFAENGLVAFDVSVATKPEKLTEDLKSFWGGYAIHFKVIERRLFDKFGGDLRQLRVRAAALGKNESTRFSIQVSKHEYCAPKTRHLFEDFAIFVYPPALVVCEKLRALCQQMPEYRELVRNHPSPRARDFFDISMLVKRFGIMVNTELRQMLENVFEAKHVPIALLSRVAEYREFHRANFVSVEQTVIAGFELRSFDQYFDEVVQMCRQLEALGDE